MIGGTIRDKACAGECGKLIERRFTRCRACYHAEVNRKERTRQLCADYVSGRLTRTELAEKYGLSIGRVGELLNDNGARLPAKILSQRLKMASRAAGRMGGRPPVWPDCPPHLKAEYDRLRYRYGYKSADARAMLEQDRAA